MDDFNSIEFYFLKNIAMMIKGILFIRLCFLLVLLCCLVDSQAQHDPAVMANASGESKSQNIILQWTLGEMAIQTIHTQDRLYTEGFHQPTIIAKPIYPLSKAKLEVAISPNPTSSSIQITFYSLPLADIHMELIDIKGSSLIRLTHKAGNLSAEMDLQHLNSGMYFLKMRTTDHQFSTTSKIIKL